MDNQDNMGNGASSTNTSRLKSPTLSLHMSVIMQFEVFS